MDNQAKIDAILRMTSKRLEEYFSKEGSTTDPIEYEEQLLDLGKDFARDVLRESLEPVPKSRNAKKKSLRD